MPDLHHTATVAADVEHDLSDHMDGWLVIFPLMVMIFMLLMM